MFGLLNFFNRQQPQQQGLLAPQTLPVEPLHGMGPQGIPYQDQGMGLLAPQQPSNLPSPSDPNYGPTMLPQKTPQSKGNWADNLFGGGLLGQDVGLSPEAQKGARNQALLMAGLSMMANSSKRPGPPTGLGEILLGGLQAGQQGYGQSLRSGLAGQEFKTKQAAQQASRQAGQGLDWTKPESWAEYAARLDAIPGRESDAQAARKYYAELSKPKDKPADVQEYEYARGQGYQGTFADFTKEMKRAGATNVNTNNVVNTGQKGFDNELKIRSDWRSEPVYKAFQEVESAYKQINAGLDAKSPAGDLAAATKFMKILDPTSVVRESELAMAMNASGALDRLSNYAHRLVTGEKLTESQREDFRKLAGEFYDNASESYSAKRNEYHQIASDYGMNADRVTGPAPKPRTPKQPPAANGGWSIKPVQ